MKSINIRAIAVIALVVTLCVLRGRADDPPAGGAKVSYTREIRPIFQASCAKCHLDGNRKGGLRLDTRELILKGGENGPVVSPHKSDDSSLIALLTAEDPDARMPKKGKPLSEQQIDLLKKWIDQGLPWDGPAAGPTTFYVAPLEPRAVKIPATQPGITNPIDLVLLDYFRAHNVTPGAVVEDRVFARRVYLDVIGLLPPPAELEQFIADTQPDKRDRLIDKLLADNHRYAENWLTFWNDALRNDYEGPGYIDGGRKQITPWLYDALEQNKRYDQFVRELINPTPESEGFIRGIIWRGAVSASQVRELQAAQNVSQVFLGINMKCASCHDSFVSDWKLADAYGLASVFADKPLQMFRCEKPLNQAAPIKFLYPQLGKIDATAPKEKRVAQLARLLTDPRNGRFARTIVNRIWGVLLGRALIEPVDEMDHEAWSADVLDALANDFVAHGYDLKQLLRRIMTSRAYQLPAVGSRERDENFVFRGPLVRRMSGEQFYDAVSTLTGIWQARPAAKALECRPLMLPGRWIWSTPNANTSAAVETIYLRKVIDLPATCDEALAVITCDNGFELFVNGKPSAKSDDFTRPRVVNLKPLLVPGKNVITVLAQNFSPDMSKPRGKGKKSTVPATAPRPAPSSAAPSSAPSTAPKVDNPAGFFFHGSARIGEQIVEFNSDATWKWSAQKPDGFDQPDFNDAALKPCADLGPMTVAPWRLASELESLKQKFTLHYAQLRAVWARNDALMTALGRPSRERVVTRRDSPATVLQTLELTNGMTLSNLLQQATTRPTAARANSDEIIQKLYRRGLGRPPTDQETQLARDLLGSPIRPDAIADLLWSIAMLPEFQLIY